MLKRYLFLLIIVLMGCISIRTIDYKVRGHPKGDLSTITVSCNIEGFIQTRPSNIQNYRFILYFKNNTPNRIRIKRYHPTRYQIDEFFVYPNRIYKFTVDNNLYTFEVYENNIMTFLINLRDIYNEYIK